MAESINPLVAFSDHAAQLVERTGSSIVAVHGGGRGSSSGIHWRSGVIVTAEEVLERDENIKITLPGGRLVEASLAGRDPSTDVAVLRLQPDGLPAARPPMRRRFAQVTSSWQSEITKVRRSLASASSLPWEGLGTVFAVALSIASSAHLVLSRAAEGGALIDAQGSVVGMAVLGPRHRVLAIPTSTIDRVVDQLIAKGHVFRGYLGAGLQPMRRGRPSHDTQPAGSGRGVLVVSIDPDGPAARAGLLVGDIVMTWNAKPIDRVREVMHLLGVDSTGATVDLQLIRGGAPTTLKVVIGERPVA